MRSSILLFAVAACAAPSALTDREDPLARYVADRVAGEPRRCIPMVAGQGLTIVDRRTIVYDRGRTVWVNRLEHDCQGMEPHGTLIVETHGSQYCSGDRVRSLQAGSSIPGPICILRDFTPYTRTR